MRAEAKRRWSAAICMAVSLACRAPAATVQDSPCIGDCDAHGSIVVSELVRAARIALEWPWVAAHTASADAAPLSEAQHRRRVPHAGCPCAPAIPIQEEEAQAVYDGLVLGEGDVGAWRQLNGDGSRRLVRDTSDLRVLADIRSGLYDGTTDDHYVRDHTEYAGGMPRIADGTPYADKNDDGIGDAWESRFMNEGATPTTVGFGGWTYRELFLAGKHPRTGATLR